MDKPINLFFPTHSTQYASSSPSPNPTNVALRSPSFLLHLNSKAIINHSKHQYFHSIPSNLQTVKFQYTDTFPNRSIMSSTSFLSPPAHSFSTPKFSQGAPPLSPPTSVKFRHSLPISASYTAERATGSHHIASPSSMYDVLGIQTGATFQEIKSAYRKLARVWHPDVAIASNDQNDSSAADEFIRIHAAYATLSDPQKRADYDRTLLRRRRLAALTMVTSSYTGVYGYTGRSWETDQCW